MMKHLDSPYLVGKALQKYEDWKVSILHTCKTRKEANRIEIEEIRNFNSVAPNGYNLTRGGEGGDTWSGKKNPGQSKRRKGKGNPFYGEQHSEESKNKISKRMQGKNLGKKCSDLSKETARRLAIKRNKENNPMRNPISKLKWKISYLQNRLNEQ